MDCYVLCLDEINTIPAAERIAMLGGKGANLAELSRIEGLHVPEGFCITTVAYKKITGNNLELNALVDELTHLKAEDSANIKTISAKIRKTIEGIPIPSDVVEEIASHLAKLGEEDAYAVRSSATAEDLPSASFAGQQDTYLNIIGKKAILEYISKCFASLFTDRAVMYRMQNGFDHHTIHLSVVIQKMIFPTVSGVLFTADPLTSDRKVSLIDASFGLGETLVSGRVNADAYKVRNGQISGKRISAKKLAVYASRDGGTKEWEISSDQQNKQALTDVQILQLERIGRKIEEHFGCPQDIEWCLADDIYIVQSRSITTLYPIPESNDKENHVYISVGHQQMMTDAMKPLGLSLWQLTAMRPMYKAGGRLFVDVTHQLALAGSREMLLNAMGQHDPLIKDAVMTIIKRDDFIRLLPDDRKEAGAAPAIFTVKTESDPSIISDLIEKSRVAVEELRQKIQTKSGPDLFDFIREDLQQLKKYLSDPKNVGAIKAAMDAASWINVNMEKWLGKEAGKNVADTLSQSVHNNITSEMGLELLDVADAIRPYPEVINYLRNVKNDDFLKELERFHGGVEASKAIITYLGKYGMRCAGEIDITRARWSEKPVALVPMILTNIKNFEAGESRRKFEQGPRNALEKERELLNSLKQLSDGEKKAEEAKQMIDQLRNFAGYREYSKYHIVSRSFIYKKALLKEAEQLVQSEVIREKEDLYYLTFDEFREAVRTQEIDHDLVIQRKNEHRRYEKLDPPRVITSDGEIVTGKYKREDLPVGAIAGLPVSSGIAEGRARVILNLEEASFEEGDILVTAFTDPSWTPLFVAIKGLVTEVGGLMTHGAVIAREYGLPAVVGVENATQLIKDGQRIRVNGIDGYVEIL